MIRSSLAAVAVLGIAAGVVPSRKAHAGGLEDGGNPYALDEAVRARIGAALGRACGWLLSRQRQDGSFAPGTDVPVSPLPQTALALWALSAACKGDPATDAACARAVERLLAAQQDDGGIYDPKQGLARFTAAMARQALRSWRRRSGNRALDPAIERLDLFVYRHRTLESVRDLESTPRVPDAVTVERVAELRRKSDLPEQLRRAVDFLWKARKKPEGAVALRPHPPETARSTGPLLGYDELLRFVTEDAVPSNPTLSRAYAAILKHYTLDRNPDLTRRYGERGFERGDAGLYFYYLTLARTLGAVGRAEIRTADGGAHHWARELAERLLSLQRADGSWVNAEGRWWEGDPLVATSYAVIALSITAEFRGKPVRPR